MDVLRLYLTIVSATLRLLNITLVSLFLDRTQKRVIFLFFLLRSDRKKKKELVFRMSKRLYLDIYSLHCFVDVLYHIIYWWFNLLYGSNTGWPEIHGTNENFSKDKSQKAVLNDIYFAVILKKSNCKTVLGFAQETRVRSGLVYCIFYM